jgi:hypothetical protein
MYSVSEIQYNLFGILIFLYFQLHKKGPPSAAEKEEAERLKTEGNNLMRTEKFDEALKMYSKVTYVVIKKSQRALKIC